MGRKSLFYCLAGVVIAGCSQVPAGFEAISQNGFDPVDNAADLNDYPWAMAYFQPDGKAGGQIYVGTGNGIDELVLELTGAIGAGGPAARPPEIRRYRPDRGPKEWERVFDFREAEDGPSFTSTGFRHMTVYRAQSDGRTYLYASTFGSEPALFRSATGDADSWERVFSHPTGGQDFGSIRWLTVHRGLLYVAISNDLTRERAPGELWATDGAAFWPVMQDGFGNPANHAVMALASFDGWLYAGTANVDTGFELWKLAGSVGQGPYQVIGHGGTDERNMAVSTLHVFDNALFLGSMIVGGALLRGADMLRVHPDDRWDVIVGPHSLSGYGPGFGNLANAYIWSFTEHGGALYAGTWDMSAILQFGADHPVVAISAIPGLIITALEYGAADILFGKRFYGPLADIFNMGADLYRSVDGVHWEPVFTNGLADPYNFGIRNIISLDGWLYFGMANNFDGLEIWRGEKLPGAL